MSKSKKLKAEPAATTEYVPTAAESEVLKAHLAKRKAKPRSPALRLRKAGAGSASAISVEHQNQPVGTILLMEALGTTDPDFLNGLLRQSFNVGSHAAEADESGANFVLSVIKGVEPKDQVEAMLAVQMAAVHMATLTAARQLALADNIPRRDSAERTFDKLARTFAMQMETLKRYRTGGQQKVTVEHVTVNKGGQAIVGNVQQPAPQQRPAAAPAEPPILTDQSDNVFKMESTERPRKARLNRR